MSDVSNPKMHDNIFKWLLASFIDDFFAWFFSDVEVRHIHPIDKEFIKKYEALKESIRVICSLPWRSCSMGRNTTS